MTKPCWYSLGISDEVCALMTQHKKSSQSPMLTAQHKSHSTSPMLTESSASLLLYYPSHSLLLGAGVAASP